MEPLFFKAENKSLSLKFPPDLGLQWSRFFSKRKINYDSEEVAWRFDSFNGAAFFQSGKFESLGFPQGGENNRFNGAAFFQSGKSEEETEEA